MTRILSLVKSQNSERKPICSNKKQKINDVLADI